MDHPTQQLPPQGQPYGQQPYGPQPRRARRARRAWVLPAALGSLLLAGVLAAAVLVSGPGSGDSAAVEDASLDSLLAPAAFAGDPAAPGSPGEVGAGDAAPLGKDRPWRPGRHGKGPFRLGEGEKVVAGAVGSVADGTLVVRKDNGAEVTVPTDGDTKVRGAKNRALSDLQAGERVIVKVGSDGVADGVLAVRAHAAGTVTTLDGDRATVVRAGGLSVVLDLSGVTERPAVGTIVVAVGTATDGGATLKVEQIRELPTLG